MEPLGSEQTTSNNDRFRAARAGTLRFGGLGMSVLILAFIVAVIFAANANTVVGWLVAIISLGWLLLGAFVVFGIQRAAKKAAAKLDEASNAYSAAAGRGPSSATDGTRLVSQRDDSERLRDTKLDHQFKIVQVQVRVINDELAKGESADQEQINRALETINITATNARDMIKSSGVTDEPVSGTIID